MILMILDSVSTRVFCILSRIITVRTLPDLPSLAYSAYFQSGQGDKVDTRGLPS